MKTVEELPLVDKDRQAIAAAVKLLREQFPIDKAILFGSKATGALLSAHSELQADRLDFAVNRA